MSKCKLKEKYKRARTLLNIQKSICRTQKRRVIKKYAIAQVGEVVNYSDFYCGHCLCQGTAKIIKIDLDKEGNPLYHIESIDNEKVYTNYSDNWENRNKKDFNYIVTKIPTNVK